MKVSRVLIVGLGSIGKRHLRLARELLPHVDIRVLRHQECDSIPEHANGCFSSLEQALDFAPQVAVIASPSPLHMSAALPLARAGVHLLVEKPLSASLEGVPLLLETCREQETVLLTGYNLRFLPSLLCFRELLEAQKVGRVLSVRAEVGQYLPSWRPDSDYRQNVSAQSALGGGALLELSHEIDYLRWLFGEVEWVSAVQLKQSDLEINVEDTAHLILGFASHAKEKPVVATLSMDFVRHDTTRCCIVIGENGSLRWNALEGTVEIFEPGAIAWQLLFTHQAQRDETYLAEWRHFLACVSNGQTPQVSGQDGLAVLKVIESAKLSSAIGAVVKLRQENI